MWYPDNVNFAINVESTFLIASWHELFHAFTPDSNQPRLHNVASLVDELADVSKRWCSESRFRNHVEKVQKELDEAINDEDDVLCKLPEYRSRVQYLVKEQSAVGVATGCHILSEQRHKYEEAVINSASDAITHLPKEKKYAHKSIRRVATLAFQHGKEDNDVWGPLNKDPFRDSRELFNEIVGLSIGGLKKYKCALAVAGVPSEIQSILRMVGVSPVSKSTLPASYLSQFKEPDDRLMFVGVDVESSSIRNAVVSCHKQLGLATGLVRLYQNSQSLQVHPVALVRVNGFDAIFSPSEQAFRRLYRRSQAHEDIREGLVLLTKEQNVDKRLLGAIELLSLAASNSDSRVRLINLWSSIETLCGGHEGETTLERVSSLIVPLVISRFVLRATRYLAIETQKLGEVLNSFDYGATFSRSNKDFVSPQDMMKALASAENSKSISDLLTFAQHPLLRYRIYRAWQAFHDPKSLQSLLRRSKQRLEWHIARIYRARNLLIHQGEESPFLVPLLDNLQNYLSMAVQQLIHEQKIHPTWDVRHVIEFWNGRMLHLLGSLERCPEVLTVDDFIYGNSREVLWSSS